MASASEREAPTPPATCLLAWLRAREQTGCAPCRSPFERTLPARLRFPVESLLDAERQLLSGVLLGFNRAGTHLVSYSTSVSGGHMLHVWRFASALPSPAILQASVPLFAGHLPAAVEGPFGEQPVALAIHVCESINGSLVLVHGCPPRESPDENRSGNAGGSTDVEAEDETVEAHLTALVAPWSCSPPALAHHRYTTLPDLFSPELCMLAGVEAGQLRLLLPTAEGLHEVQLALIKAAATPIALRFRLLRAFEVDKFLARVLAAPLAGGFVLVDFAVRVVDTAVIEGGEPLALLLVIAVLRRGGTCRPLEMVLSLQGGTARVAGSRELRSTPPSLSAHADARCDVLCRRARGLVKRPSALPYCLDNAGVVSHGRSAAALCHATLPLEIAGFVRAAGE